MKSTSELLFCHVFTKSVALYHTLEAMLICTNITFSKTIKQKQKTKQKPKTEIVTAI